MENENKDAKLNAGKTANIKWNIPDNIITRVSTLMVTQIIESYIKLMFFETKAEVITDPDINPSEVTAICVASVVIPPEKIPAIVNVLNKQYENYQGMIKKINETSEPKQPS